MSEGLWHALVLAGGRGPGDPMAKAYGVTHKCLVPVGGAPMLSRVVAPLMACREIAGIRISIESRDVAAAALGDLLGSCDIVSSRESAARSAIAALEHEGSFPCLLTTGDHPLLTPQMVRHFLAEAVQSGADLCAGVASRQTIEAAFPDARRTYIRFADVEVSGCNLFALANPQALAALDFWHHLEPVRKKPWRLAGAFGLIPLIRFLTRRLTLDQAFAIASHRLQLDARPILLPFAEAAVDVDKPADKELAERIFAARHNS
jgi:GTP:adenosylcobinamide-phosphate guanylyltransferase